ncbi:MAG: hypothetical protein Q8N48_09690 [Thiobacillus sp.]|nr:hypothetical protein [Thiobacillus sp.]MDP2979081.1 hypothetical protein [Thiobacillus sp.]
MGGGADLRVVPVPQCGWSDLDTPHRVSERLNLISGNRFSANDSFGDAIFLDLAETATRANEGERVTQAAM